MKFGLTSGLTHLSIRVAEHTSRSGKHSMCVSVPSCPHHHESLEQADTLCAVKHGQPVQAPAAASQTQRCHLQSCCRSGLRIANLMDLLEQADTPVRSENMGSQCRPPLLHWQDSNVTPITDPDADSGMDI